MMGRAGATYPPPPIYLNVIHFTKFYNINQLPRYAVIPPMSHGVLNNNMMGVIKLGWVRLGYVIYTTGENLTILLYTLFPTLSSLLQNKPKNFKTLDKLDK